MNVSFRSLILIAAAFSATSVAPAVALHATTPGQVEGAELVTAVAPVEASTLLDDKLAGQDDAVEAPLAGEALDDDATDDLGDKSGAALPKDLASLVAELRASKTGSRELDCLAGAIYFESKGEPLKGQLAVGQVIANRASSGRFPSSYCGVVFQRGQFSFVRGGNMPSINHGSLAWRNAVAVARIVDGDLHKPTIGKAMFFHAKRVSPGWKRSRVATIGNHIFYH